MRCYENSFVSVRMHAQCSGKLHAWLAGQGGAGKLRKGVVAGKILGCEERLAACSVRELASSATMEAGDLAREMWDEGNENQVEGWEGAMELGC